jgi:hypothetical protein
LKELARSYLTISKDLGRMMSRLKAIYRSWGIPCTGKQVYAPRYRSEWLGKIDEAGVRRQAVFYYQQLDAQRPLRKQVRQELLAEAHRHEVWKLLRRIPFIGPIRAALIRWRSPKLSFQVDVPEESKDGMNLSALSVQIFFYYIEGYIVNR